MITMYNVVSADGFISRMDRSEDFIPDSMWPEFLEICQRHGAVIMGRKTYDTVQRYEESLLRAFESLSIKRIVVSRDENFKPKPGYVVVRSPKEACEMAQDALLCSGPTLNTSLLKEGLIGKVILDKLPVKVEQGFRIFEDDIKPIFRLLKKEEKPGGRKREEYEVELAAAE